MPTWRDTLAHVKGEPRVVEATTTGYPRFFIHRSIQLLARICEEKFGTPGECCMLVSSAKLADAGRFFLQRHSPIPIAVRVVQHALSSSTVDEEGADSQNDHQASQEHDSCPQQVLERHMLFFPADSFLLAKSYWQCSGHGISSRRAYRCLELLGIPLPDALNLDGGLPPRSTSSSGTSNSSSPGGSVESLQDGLSQNQTMRLVQSDEQLLPYAEARVVLQRRIARALEGDFSNPTEPSPLPISPNKASGSRTISDDDVFLYPGGMNAIWHAHQLILQAAEQMGKVPGKSICFGFPYTCTLKVLEKFGPGCYLFGAGVDDDLSEVRRVAQEATSSGIPIVALFCEVSTNPLLRTPNLVELRKIADEFDFLMVVDDSLGNFVNVDVMEHTDIVPGRIFRFARVLLDAFDSLVLNPQRRHYGWFAIASKPLTKTSTGTKTSSAWNSTRGTLPIGPTSSIAIQKQSPIGSGINQRFTVYNTAHDESQNSDGKKRVIKNVFYPKWAMRERYDACRRRPASFMVTPRYPSGFGGRFTILFSDERAARVFYDNLGCEKGPTWGTNFTLACPYTILAHHRELDWAARYGVPINIVRISVGMEDEETILGWVKHALAAAQKASERSS
ncbi:hypothetical protein M407DRAFT_25227 [Tulasnella calospora MUT 4182]|uniref:Uncharacterized protein n=1 Tax=Tulasnella calospora MUT 4182 TaxID=1051891 RepID=A0A0C3KVF6_9AGAM|nr:hypothetical protein M407DRAFT_25227 [Tulasnella calospora MUT 4182]